MAQNEAKALINEKISSQRGRNFITFFIFLLISTGLWCVKSLNDTTERDFKVNIVVSGLPDGISYYTANDSLIAGDNSIGTFTVIVKEKGIFRKTSKDNKGRSLVVNFTDFHTTDDNTYYLPADKVESALQNYFGNDVIIVTWKPSVVSFKAGL